MPSANMLTMTLNNGVPPTQAPSAPSSEYNITTKDVENLVLEIKENLRLTSTMKSISCSQYLRKSSRASPYQLGRRSRQDVATSSGDVSASSNVDAKQDDPYELLQKLLRDGGLLNEAVRRVQLGLQNQKQQKCFYDSDDSHTPPLIL